ncbi:DUF4359 domain-containing protein [Pleurocapsales cyanobacterium LEGE 10410]|nr:DUF4359 domain-containing protein [Pleurocapsales cyanobacterium LEGE 10410]
MNYMTLKNIGIGGIITVGIAAIAFLTNPGEQKYQRYADSAIKTHFRERICTQVSQDLGVWLESQCHILINTTSPYLAEVVNQQTTRQNFLLFSIYQADLALPSPLPKYHLETIGILGNFYTYQAKKL